MDVCTKVRKKPCRHCLFTKHAATDHSNLAEQRAQVLFYDKQFICHEHSCNTVMCASHAAKRPALAIGLEKVGYNGDLKHHYSNMTKEERSKFSVNGS